MKKSFFPILLIFAMLIFHEDVIKGSISGLLLWYQTLIPALLPFIIIANALSEMGLYRTLSFNSVKFPHIYELFAIIIGNLCGYPIGAKIINDLVLNHYISKEKANSLIPLSSQASPMFLIGYVYTYILNKSIPLYIFCISVYSPVIILYIVKTKIYDTALKINPETYCPSVSSHINYSNNRPLDLTETFLNAARTMVLIGIYVMIFSIILQILTNRINSTPLTDCILSFLEITTGLNLLKNLSLNIDFCIPIICCLSSFGGLCAMYQIKSVLTYSGSSIKKYLPDKIIMSAGTFILISIYLKTTN